MHVSAIARTYAHVLDRKQYSQTQTHANKRTQTITAIDAWAISACKRDCVLRVGSEYTEEMISTFYVYKFFFFFHGVSFPSTKHKSSRILAMVHANYTKFSAKVHEGK